MASLGSIQAVMVFGLVSALLAWVAWEATLLPKSFQAAYSLDNSQALVRSANRLVIIC